MSELTSAFAQYLLAVIDLSRPSHFSSPLLGSAPVKPSPILFPPSPAPSAQRDSNSDQGLSSSSPTALSLAALETLLCAMVDRPLNVRVFEKCDGLATVVRVLKDKTVAHVVRYRLPILVNHRRCTDVPLLQNQSHRDLVLLLAT